MVRFTSIESLRAWMAWWVVFGHALHLGGFSGADKAGESGLWHLMLKVLTSGSTSVLVFVIVSGFVIAHLVVSKSDNYGFYIVRRAFRIFPIYLFCLFLALLLRPLYMEAYASHDWVIESAMRRLRIAEEDENFVTHLLLHVTMLHGAIPDSLIAFASSTFLAPAWSLSLEWQFYLVAPIVVSLLAGRPVVALGTGAALLGIAAWFYSGSVAAWRYPSVLPLGLPYFILGISSRLMLQPHVEQKRFAGLVLVALVCLPMVNWRVWPFWGMFYLFAMMESGKLAHPNGLLGRIIKLIALNSVLARLGSWSYATYLSHIPVFALVVGGGARLLGPAYTQTTSWLLIALAVMLVLPISWLLYSIVERPFILMGSRVLGTRGKVVLA